MQSDCTKSWQVGQRVLSIFSSDPVSLSSKALPVPKDGQHLFHTLLPPPKLYAQVSICGIYTDAYLIIWNLLFLCPAPTVETFLPSIP